MRNSLLLFLFLFSLPHMRDCFAQNLVPNPSFEIYSQCPDNISGIGDDQVARATGWSTYRETSDYFNTCGTIWNVGVPDNQPGYQYAHSGNAYCGIITTEITSSDYKEIIGCQLQSPLSVGQKYFLSFFVNWAGKPGNTIATSKMGALLSTVSYDYFNPVPINNSATFHTDSILQDSINWVRLSWSFVADSAYSFLSIGDFFADANTDTLNLGPFPFRSYYFIDDVCLSTDSLYNETWTGINELNKDFSLKVFPNPTSDILNLSFPTFGDAEVSIYDRLGRRAYSATARNQHSLTLNLGAFSPGVYLLRLVSEKDGRVVVRKVVKL